MRAVRQTAAAALAAMIICTGCGTGLRHTTKAHPAVLNNWGKVQRLPRGTYVIVNQHAGKDTRGLLVKAEPHEITIDDFISELTFPRSNIYRILITHNHADREAVKGFAKGAVLCGAVGGLAGGLPGAAAGGLVCGAAVGLVGGAYGLIFKNDEILVYHSDAGRPAPPAVP